VIFKALGALIAFGLGLTSGPSMASAACTPWDIKDTCCLAACAAKRGSNWPKADEILRGCMRGLGCSESEVKDATVFMNCDCPEKETDDPRGRDRQSGYEFQRDEGQLRPTGGRPPQGRRNGMPSPRRLETSVIRRAASASAPAFA
jgi:hypothetical protein